MSGRMLRPEARPLELEELSLSQLETLDQVVESMAEAHGQLHSSERQESTPKLDPKRSSRLFFVSGEPGIGKTTIYTTLRKLLPEERGAQGRDGGRVDAFRYDMDKRKKLKARIRERLVSLAGCVRWLEPLDLEPLSGSINFLAAVLVRIERALEPGRGSKSRASVGGLLDRSPETREAMMDLTRFQNELTMSWDGNLHARAAHVEPDQYASEVLRAEKARLAVNQRLQGILSKLIPLGEEQSRKPTLFMLVVDDLYLNPASSIELLRLLRMISSPQLFVLLLGDYDPLEYLFYQQTLGDYIKLAGDTALEVFGENYKEALRSRAWALAAGSLRKLLPPKQRKDLWPLWIDEALGFKALDAREKDAGEKDELKDLLEQLPIQQGGFPANVKELVTAGWPTQQERERYVYSGTLLLEMSQRHATDLWMTLVDKEQPPSVTDTVWRLGEEFHAALNEQSRVGGEQKKELELAVTHGRDRSVLYDYGLNAESLSIEIEESDIIDEPTSDMRGSITGTTRVRAPARLDWNMCLKKKKEKEKELDMPPTLLGWLVVLHDALALGRPQNLMRGHLVGGKDFRWVGFSWKEKESSGGGRDDGPIYWPAPEWKTFLELDLLRGAWNSLKDEGGGQSIHWEVRAFRWFDAICAILAGRNEREFVRFDKPSEPPAESHWKGLVGRVSALVASIDGSGGGASEIVRKWVVDVGVVVALRLGISEAVASYFEQEEKLNAFWRADMEINKILKKEPDKRGRHEHVARYFPDVWPPPIRGKDTGGQARSGGETV